MPVTPAAELVFFANGKAMSGANFRRQLEAVGDEALNDLKTANLEGVEQVLAEALRRVPVGLRTDRHHKSGRLKATIKGSASKVRGTVRAGTKAKTIYAWPIHFGWANRSRGGPIAPNPFLYEALDDRRDEVKEAYENQIADIIDKYL
jgi:hypothetical protein